MLQIKLICVGRLRERFYIDAFQEYAKRLSGYCRLETAELQEMRLPEAPSPAQIAAALDREAEDIFRALPKDAFTVALCVEGREISSEELSALLLERENSGRPRLCFVIGGSFGLAQRVKDAAQLRLSLSKMTFPHHLARVILAEQLYRGFKIKEGSRYHK